MSCFLFARALHPAQVSARQFPNMLFIPPPNGFSWDQVSSDAERSGPGQNELEGGELVDTSRGN